MAAYGLVCPSVLQVPLWLDTEQTGGTFNRPRALKQLFFDVFVSAKTGKLHWTTLVSGGGWGSVRWVGQCEVGGAV